MRKYVFFALSSFALFACQQEQEVAELTTQSSPDEVIHLKNSEAAIISRSNLYLIVNDIQDSRCPANANCVRLGEVLVEIQLKEDTNLVHEVTLCLGDCNQPVRSNQSSFSYEGRSYALKLAEVLPYPGLAEEGEQITATLEWTQH